MGWLPMNLKQEVFAFLEKNSVVLVDLCLYIVYNVHGELMKQFIKKGDLMATFSSGFKAVLNIMKQDKLHFYPLQISFWRCLSILSFSILLQGPYLQGEILYSDYDSFATGDSLYNDFEGRDHSVEPIYMGSCCKKPIQGPPGPAFNSYISRMSRTVQTLTSFDFALINFEIPIVSSGDWAYSGTAFTCPTSGIYMVSFKVMFNMSETFPGASALGIQLFNTLPVFDIYLQSFSEIQNLSNPSPFDRPITLESTFMIDYVAGTPLTFSFFGANLTPDTSFSAGASASMAIFRIN